MEGKESSKQRMKISNKGEFNDRYIFNKTYSGSQALREAVCFQVKVNKSY